MNALVGRVLLRRGGRCSMTSVPAYPNNALGSIRRMGGAQPESQSMQAKFLDGMPMDKGFEKIIFATYVVGGVLIWMSNSHTFTPNTSIKTVSV